MRSVAPSPDIDHSPDMALRPSAAAQGRLIAGAITTMAVKIFVRESWKRVLILSAILFLIGCAVLVIYPVRYAATALVVIDPREQRVTADPDVLAGIGQDAAALQSVVEIAKSDGFLLPLISKLHIENDPDIARGETDGRRILDLFRSRIDISRRGLTYVIAITFNSNDAAKSAQYANAIADAFVASQTQVRTDAADEAAGWLKSRLKTLSDQLRVSEDAVAAFKLEYGIVNAGRDSTTGQLRVTELNQQVSAARLRTEEAKARYEQSQRDIKSNVEGAVRSDLLSVLRAQRLQLNDQIAQKSAVFGYRHPDIVIANSQLEALNRQIETERKRNTDTAKSDYETFAGQQKALEKQLSALESGMLVDGQAAVKLQELQRDADANRNIYEQYLSRFKTTNEQRLLQASQTKVASVASQPTRPTRPTLSLLLAGLAVASVMTSTAGVALLGSSRAAALEARTFEAAKSFGPNNKPIPAFFKTRMETPPPAATPGSPPALPWARIPFLPALAPMRTIWQKPGDAAADLDRSLQTLSDAIASHATGRARLIVVTSLEPKVGKTLIASSLLRTLSDRRMRGVLVTIAPDNVPHTIDHARQAITTDAKSLLTLLADSAMPNASAPSDILNDFDLIVVDAPPIAQSPRLASITKIADYVAIVIRSGDEELGAYQRAVASLGTSGHAVYGMIISDSQPQHALAI